MVPPLGEGTGDKQPKSATTHTTGAESSANIQEEISRKLDAIMDALGIDREGDR